MLLIASFSLLALWVFVWPVVAYTIDRKGLRKFPSPSLSGLSSIWRMYHNLKCEHYLAIHNAHKKLGMHVRIAPNHISVLSTQALNDIYGHGANMLKDPWYDGGAGEFRNIADARVKAEHQSKRKMLAHVFAHKTILNLEPVVADSVDILVKQIDNHIERGQKINLRRYINYFTIDFFSEFLYGQSLKCMERGNDVVDAESRDGKIYKVGMIKALHDSMTINTIMGMEAGLLPLTKKLLAYHPYRKAGSDYENIIYHSTKTYVKDQAGAEDEDDDGGSIFSKLRTNSRGEPTGICEGDLLAECSVMMNAGTDTTTAALTNTMFLLMKHPKVLAKLREELDDAGLGSADVPKYEDVSKLPYLRACIEEALRVRPASTFGLPRVVPKGGRVVAGEFIAEGVTVSVPTYSILRHEESFDEPERFKPDRWLVDDVKIKERMAKAHFPFSVGPRACIGRNIAYFEQILVVAALVRHFDFSLPSEDFEMRTIERFNSNPDELIVSCKRRY